MVIAYIPTQVELTYLVAENIEASTMAMITSVFIMSYEVGAKWMTAAMGLIFDVDNDHMGNYDRIIIAKIPMILIIMLMVKCFPTNYQIK